MHSFSISWLSAGEGRIKLGPAEMEEKRTMSMETPIPVLESSGAALILVVAF